MVKNWTKEADGVWKVEVPNSLFGDFNPLADEVSGDWFNPKGRRHHTNKLIQNIIYPQYPEKQCDWYAKIYDFYIVFSWTA